MSATVVLDARLETLVDPAATAEKIAGGCVFTEGPLWSHRDNTLTFSDVRGDTMYRHAIVNGCAHALIEIRQNLIADNSGAEEWASRLAPIVDAINRRPDIHEVKQFGSRTGPV